MLVLFVQSPYFAVGQVQGQIKACTKPDSNDLDTASARSSRDCLPDLVSPRPALHPPEVL